MIFSRWLVKLVIFWRLGWRRVNLHLLRSAFRHHGNNFIFDPRDNFSYNHIEVGDDVSIGTGALFIASESKIIIGNKVMFGPNVTIIGGNHNTSVVGRFMYDVHEKRPEDDQDIIFEDDVWVGSCAVILKGVKVGRGSIVAAGALVNKDVPPYTVVGGIPARIISMRFGNLETIMRHEDVLYSPEKRFSKSFLQNIINNV